MTLAQLLGLSGAARAGTGPGGTGPGGAPGWADLPESSGWRGPGAAAGPGYDCDASIAPMVSGHVDPEVLDRLVGARSGAHFGDHSADRHDGVACGGCEADGDGVACGGGGAGGADGAGGACGDGGACGGGGACGDGGAGPAGEPSAADRLGRAFARELTLRDAIAMLSGPAGLAAYLRAGRFTGPAGSISLPLDVGTATDTIPPHLRRAVIARDQHCGFPGGCDQPPSACQVHHIVPRSEGGPTRLDHLMLGCAFHHLIVIHRWGWKVVINADGTKTAISPDGKRVIHSHSPPPA